MSRRRLPRAAVADLARLVESVREQLGTFSYLSGTLRHAARLNTVTLTRAEWAALYDHLDALLRGERGRVKDGSADELRALWAVTDELRKAARSGDTISEAEAIRRVGGKSTRRRYYAAKRRAVRDQST